LEVLTAVRQLVERQFSVSLDLADFYRRVASDPVLSLLTRHFRGLRIPQSPNIFAAVVSAILDQQVNLAFAFPSPGALAILSPRDLRKIQISGPKARYIIAIARDALDGRLDLEGLRGEEPATAHARLLEQRGIGPWTAFFVGLLAMSHLDALPSGDVGLQSAIHAFYGLGRRPSPARVERLAQNWSGWRSYATFYLWLTYWETPQWRKEFILQLRGGQYARKRSLAKS